MSHDDLINGMFTFTIILYVAFVTILLAWFAVSIFKEPTPQEFTTENGIQCVTYKESLECDWGEK